jgi:putative ABC transport system permease protein
MIRTRGRKILGDVFERKGRTLLVSAAIFIGVLGTIALFSMSDIIISQLREDIKEDELSMLSVFLSVNVGEQLDNQLYLEQLGELPGVTEVIGSTFGGQVVGYFKLSEEDEEFEQGELISYSTPLDQMPIEPMRLIDGAYPQEGANELAIEQRMAEEYDLRVGDQLFFRVLSPSRDESFGDEIGTIEAWTISGVVFHAYTFSPNQSMYFASVADANYLSATPGFSTFSARFVDFPTAEDQQDAFATYIADETPYRPDFIQAQDPAANDLITGAQTLASTMSFLALLALLVSGFLVINVISSIVVEQKRQIGVMKSMGASRFDNFVIYAGIAFVYGLIAVIPAVILGIPAGNAASHALAPELNTVVDGFKISPGSVVLGILVGLLIPVLASLIPVYFGTRVQILDAMTDLGIDANYGSGPIARLINILPVPITVRQGFSNVSLKKSRLVFTVITLAIAAGAFMGIFAVFSSLTGGISMPAASRWAGRSRPRWWTRPGATWTAATAR